MPRSPISKTFFQETMNIKCTEVLTMWVQMNFCQYNLTCLNFVWAGIRTLHNVLLSTKRQMMVTPILYTIGRWIGLDSSLTVTTVVIENTVMTLRRELTWFWAKVLIIRIVLQKRKLGEFKITSQCSLSSLIPQGKIIYTVMIISVCVKN